MSSKKNEYDYETPVHSDHCPKKPEKTEWNW